ncbi:MAG: hypothetical protein AYP45_06025 [Candidatus Brocadia carolinensis]|uniref:Transposase IS701-like DDE domain-containing protein n=1 Tax=Candidatus Brocadia carolinensis TaxID=1004156 RepID=A0A1V4AV31_9BACT|nr:MAG: hypothetical protein AYP45_06025 [Candidatus Brocadia caroliniensis]
MGYPAIKCTRREIIQKQRTTAPTKNGFLAIDDTGCPKPFAKKTEGAQLQYCGPLKRKEVCNVGVAFVSDSKHFPIDITPYLPASSPEEKNNSQVKDKIQIARKLFDLSAENFALSGKELKDTFYFDHYQVRHINKIERDWNLCHVAWTLTYGIKQNVYLTKILETKPKTFNEIKQAINAMLEFASTNALSKNK